MRSSRCFAATTTSRSSTPMRASCSSARLEGVDDPEQQAQDHRQRLHRCVRGRSEEDRRRRIPGARHALSRRDRKRLRARRPVGHHQVASQCRRPARAHAYEAGRALARSLQGRGARARARARPAGGFRRAPSVSRARASRSAFPGEITRGEARRSCARPMRSISTRSARRGLYDEIWQAFAVLLPVQDRRRHGR